jgi:hypothetical protein
MAELSDFHWLMDLSIVNDENGYKEPPMKLLKTFAIVESSNASQYTTYNSIMYLSYRF